jgi:EAL domain-containing protein (putative c-di-GMP-specific phosphodiesterase class I)/CheY-like chemotaxis protein
MLADRHCGLCANSNNNELPRMLVIDDDPLFLHQMKIVLRGKYSVQTTLRAVEDEAACMSGASAVILDLNMPGVDGVSFIKTIATLEPKPKLLIASGHELSILELAKRTANMYGLHQTDVLQKPLTRSAVLKALAKLDRPSATAGARSTVMPPRFSDEEVFAAFKAGQFTAVYQPQVSVVSAEVIGIEALARWDHPDFGRLSPASFIEQIEDSNLVLTFTLQIAETAIRDTVQLEKDTGAAVKISINVPPQVLESEIFIDALMEKLTRHGLPTQRFQCEITERGLENPDPVVLASMARLRMKGVQLSIDDFGVGQSGLAKLKSRAFDEIKIDRSFIQDLASSSDSRSIVESIMQLSRMVGLRIIAEGVEDKLTLKHSKVLGIQNIQGFYFAKPMPAAELAQWVTNWGSRSKHSQENTQ